MAVMLTDLADVLRKAGLDVVEIPGWKTRGRPGDFNPKGVLCHHTAGAGDGYNDAYAMATVGRTDLNPPLAQLALSRKGTWYILAAGRANHAGRCKAIGGLTPYPGETYGDGNAQLVGIEAQNRGTDAEDWTPAQYGAYVRGVAALTRHYGWSIVFGHKETSTTGKVDPDFPMDQFRRDVAAAQEDDMPSAEEIAKAVWEHKVPRPNDTADAPAGSLLGGANVYSWRAANGTASLEATVAAQAAALALLANGQAVDVEQIKAAIHEAVSNFELTLAPKKDDGGVA